MEEDSIMGASQEVFTNKNWMVAYDEKEDSITITRFNNYHWGGELVVDKKAFDAKEFIEDTRDILVGYDGEDTIEGLKGLIDETKDRLTELLNSTFVVLEGEE